MKVFGIEVLKKDRGGKFRTFWKLFKTQEDLNGYVTKYISNRPANARKVQNIKYFEAETTLKGVLHSENKDTIL